MGVCTYKKSGSVHTHRIIVHSRKDSRCFFYDVEFLQLRAIGNARIPLFFAEETRARCRQKLSGCLLDVQNLRR